MAGTAKGHPAEQEAAAGHWGHRRGEKLEALLPSLSSACLQVGGGPHGVSAAARGSASDACPLVICNLRPVSSLHCALSGGSRCGWATGARVAFLVSGR